MTIAFTSPKLTPRPSPAHGQCIVAVEPFEPGEILVVWGGDVLDGAALAALPEEYSTHVIQVETDLFLVSSPPWPSADYVNHSCDPNGRLRGAITLVADRPIAPGEEITFDYATCDSQPYNEFECRCGAATCRGRVTAEDWRRPDLQARYGEAFSPYLLERIRAR